MKASMNDEHVQIFSHSIFRFLWFFYHSSAIFAMVRSATLHRHHCVLIWFDFDLINFFVQFFFSGEVEDEHIFNHLCFFSHDWISWCRKMIPYKMHWVEGEFFFFSAILIWPSKLSERNRSIATVNIWFFSP